MHASFFLTRYRFCLYVTARQVVHFLCSLLCSGLCTPGVHRLRHWRMLAMAQEPWLTPVLRGRVVCRTAATSNPTAVFVGFRSLPYRACPVSGPAERSGLRAGNTPVLPLAFEVAAEGATTRPRERVKRHAG